MTATRMISCNRSLLKKKHEPLKKFDHQYFNSACKIATTFSALGNMAASKPIFSGTAGRFKAPNTSTGASNHRKQVLEIRPARASANELACCSSVSTKHLPCFFTV